MKIKLRKFDELKKSFYYTIDCNTFGSADNHTIIYSDGQRYKYESGGYWLMVPVETVCPTCNGHGKVNN